MMDAPVIILSALRAAQRELEFIAAHKLTARNLEPLLAQIQKALEE